MSGDVILLEHRREVPGTLWWSGTFRCMYCVHEHAGAAPFPSWAAAPPAVECPGCGRVGALAVTEPEPSANAGEGPWRAVDELRIDVDGNPWDGRVNARDRAAVTRAGRLYNRKQAGYREYVARVAAAARAAVARSGVAFPSGLVEVTVQLRGPRKAKKHCGGATCAADIDGPIKAILDGLAAGGSIANDVQVARLVVTKAIGPYGATVFVRPA